MTTPNLISIIMVTHQTGPVLYRAIASVLAQKEQLEFVLVNNGNPPEVEAKLVEKFKDVPSVRVMTGHGDIGLVKGRNLGARVASGDHFLFISDNCLLPPECLTVLRQEAQTKEEPFVLAARLLDEKGHEKEMSRLALLTPPVAALAKLGLASFFPAQRLSLAKDKISSKTAPVPAVGGDFFFCSKKEYLAHRGFNEKYFQELSVMDFCFRLSHEGGSVHFIPRLVVPQGEKGAAAFDPQTEKNKVLSYARYFYENFGDTYPQPVLWALNLVYGARLGLSLLLKRKSAVL